MSKIIKDSKGNITIIHGYVEDEQLYRLIGKLVDRNTGQIIKQQFPRIEVGYKKDLEKRIPLYEDSWNTGRTDGYIWKFTLKPAGY